MSKMKNNELQSASGGAGTLPGLATKIKQINKLKANAKNNVAEKKKKLSQLMISGL